MELDGNNQQYFGYNLVQKINLFLLSGESVPVGKLCFQQSPYYELIGMETYSFVDTMYL